MPLSTNSVLPRWDDLYIYMDISSGTPYQSRHNGLLLEWIQTRWGNSLFGTIYLIPLLPNGIYGFDVNEYVRSQLEKYQADLADEIPQGIMSNILGDDSVEFDPGPPIKLVYPLRTINWLHQSGGSRYYRNFTEVMQPDIIVSPTTKHGFLQKFPAISEEQRRNWDEKPVLFITARLFGEPGNQTSGKFDTLRFLYGPRVPRDSRNR